MQEQNKPKTIHLTPLQRKVYYDLAAAVFHENQKPINLSEGQIDILAAILDPQYQRVVIGTTTQYGKSMTIGYAVLLAASMNDKARRIKIIAPSKEQGKIIMNYALSHVGDHEAIYSGLMESNKVLKKKTEFSKNRLAWVHGSEISVVSADAGRNVEDVNKAGSSAMGFGGDIIIVDEAALIPKLIMDKILRMLGANPDSKLILIGNPFNQNYFYRASKSARFYKIWIDYQQAIKEGRLTAEFIEEMREEMDPRLFRILYEVRFGIGTEDSFITTALIEAAEQGVNTWLPLIDAELTDEQKELFGRTLAWQADQIIKVGVDVARFGTDKSAIVIRQGARILFKKQYSFDTMALVGELQKLQEIYGFDWADVAVDATGIGGGPIDRLYELGYDICEVSNAAAAETPTVYFNLGAELWGRVSEALIKNSLLIEDSEIIKQLADRKYEYRARKSGAVLKLESKENMKKRGIKSPDLADALSLTYFETENPYLSFVKSKK